MGYFFAQKRRAHHDLDHRNHRKRSTGKLGALSARGLDTEINITVFGEGVIARVVPTANYFGI